MDGAALGGRDPNFLQPLFPTTTIRTTSAAAQGYVVAVTVTVPDVEPGGTGFFKVVLFNGADCASSSIRAETAVISVANLGGGPVPPPALVGLQGVLPYSACPEPATISLVALAGMALFLTCGRRGAKRASAA